ncbi:hypothetical protein N7509_003379 [Penicillium cosmopolitanum]|uniref:F-box domain-containing protein n=1 Tax=Penicillium cosmopolitanum TaxID=1131564 RepID=A0A9W9W562_9EURO|nr:uncharacterized protein N7509_003379 [Penicillium cosmopolitanum]KAJ5403508.1 hypothetical protein N7509_003379 [Penicillium cosmopolitanum]
MQANGSHQQRALEMPEIVTLILRQMDMGTLLTSQRVCHMWADLIRESKTLQQDLYFLPTIHEDNKALRYRNSLLAEKFQFLNSLVDLNDEHKYAFEGSRECEWSDISLRNLDLLKSATKQEQYMRPEASWRRMLTHQPPLYTVGKFDGGSGRFGTRWTQSKSPEQVNGLRLETLFYWIANLLLQSECEISIYIGGSLTTDVKHVHHGRSTGWRSREVNGDWDRMVREFDLVLAQKFPFFGSCWFQDSDGEEEARKPTQNESILAQIHGLRQEMSRILHGLDFESYNEGSDHSI